MGASPVALLVVAGGRVDLDKVMRIGGTYYYRLTPIPITHDFIGDSNVFAFVFAWNAVGLYLAIGIGAILSCCFLSQRFMKLYSGLSPSSPFMYT